MCANGSVLKNEDSTTHNPNIPLVARCWLAVYNNLPIVTIGKTLNVSMMLASAMFLTSIRFLAEYLLVTVFGWPEGDTFTKEAAASCGSICHSTLLCIGLIVAFQNTEKRCDPAARMEESPQWWQHFADALLQFCTGYMVYDALVNILFLRWDPLQPWALPVLNEDDKLFLMHHIMTTTYMTSARVIGAGHMSAMTCMLLGELTNPLHNLFMIGEVAMKLECCNGPLARKAHTVVSVAFAAMYNLFRAILAPPTFVVVSYYLILTKKGRTNIPIVINILWNLMIWAVVFGSGSWIQKCHGILMDFITTQFGSGKGEIEKEL
jgi:hypothetical protein